jgi:5-methylcytosine-specific restriction enzyme A
MPEYEKWYHTQRWQRRSARQRREHPLCKMCLDRGIVERAEVADHVIAHKGDYQLFWFGALQSLCLRCHTGTKQRAEKSGQSFDRSIGADGFPVSADHPFNRRE